MTFVINMDGIVMRCHIASIATITFGMIPNQDDDEPSEDEFVVPDRYTKHGRKRVIFSNQGKIRHTDLIIFEPYFIYFWFVR